MIIQRSQFLLKAETVKEGQAATGFAATNLVLTEDLDFTVDVAMHERNQMRSTLSRPSAVAGLRQGTITGKVALKGSGITLYTGHAPEFDSILKCCGMDSLGATGATCATTTYTPVANDPNTLGKSYTCQLMRDGKMYTLLGCRGTGKFVWEVALPGYFEFEIHGAINDLDDQVLYTGAAYDSSNPVPFMNAATKFSYDSYESLISKVEVDLANTLAMRHDANAASGFRSCYITARNPVGTLDPEEIAKATYDFYDKMVKDTEGVLTFKLGTIPGNIYTFNAPKVQVMSYGASDREGVMVSDQALKFNLSTADDEFSIEFK